jgi:sorbitol-specific phosphotransferase system component IIC
MASRDLDIIVKAKDSASAKLKSMNSSIQAGLNKTAVAAAAMGAALALGLKNAVNSAIDAERAQRQLETAIISLSGGTQAQVASIDAYATSMEKKIGLDADALKMGAAQLGTFQLQSTTVEALTKSVADLTVNNNGLTASGDQYITSANMIAKALRGQFGILEKQGIVFTDAQQSIILHGTEMEKAAAIQEGFTQNLRETTDTVGGLEVEQAKLTQTLGEVSEKIGTALVPMIISLLEEMQPIIESVSNWVTNNTELIATFVKWSAVILPIMIVLPMLTTAVTAMGAAMAFVAANPITLLIAGLAGLVAAGVLVAQNWEAVKKAAVETWNKIAESLSAKLASMKEFIAEFAESSFEILDGFFSGLLETVKGSMSGVQTAWESSWSGLKGFATGILDSVVGSVKGVIATIAEAIAGLKSLLKLSNEASSSSVRGGGGSRKRASGGNVFAGQTTMVGERGPEMVTFGQSGNVTPNSQLGGGGVNIQVNITGNTLLSESPEIGEKIGNLIIDQLRLQTRLS